MIYVLIALSIFLIDQYSKNHFDKNIKIGEYKSVYKDKLFFTNIKNKGALLGFLKNNRVTLLISSFVATVVVGVLFVTTLLGENKFLKLGITFLTGGCVGNVYDRFKKGEVTDFICIKSKKLPIFNIADVFIFLGAIISIITYLKED